MTEKEYRIALKNEGYIRKKVKSLKQRARRLLSADDEALISPEEYAWTRGILNYFGALIQAGLLTPYFMHYVYSWLEIAVNTHNDRLKSDIIKMLSEYMFDAESKLKPEEYDTICKDEAVIEKFRKEMGLNF